MLHCMLVCVGLCIDIIDTSNHVYNIYGLWENNDRDAPCVCVWLHFYV